MVGWILGLAMGCGTASLCERASEIDPTLEPGLGEEAFERPIADGDLVGLSFGSQGGSHLWLAVRTAGFAPGRRVPIAGAEDVPVFVASLADLSGGTLVEQSWAFDAMEGDETSAEIALGTFVMPDSIAYARTDVLLTVAGTDVCGTELVAERSLTITGD